MARAIAPKPTGVSVRENGVDDSTRKRTGERGPAAAWAMFGMIFDGISGGFCHVMRLK